MEEEESNIKFVASEKLCSSKWSEAIDIFIHPLLLHFSLSLPISVSLFFFLVLSSPICLKSIFYRIFFQEEEFLTRKREGRKGREKEEKKLEFEFVSFLEPRNPFSKSSSIFFLFFLFFLLLSLLLLSHLHSFSHLSPSHFKFSTISIFFLRTSIQPFTLSLQAKYITFSSSSFFSFSLLNISISKTDRNFSP